MGIKNLSFIDNAPPQADAQFLNSAKAEPNNVITSTGEALSDANLSQLAAAIAVYSAGSDYYNDTGTANAYVLSPVGAKSAPPNYFAGMRVRFIVANASTGASTINVNSLGSQVILQANGVDPIASGDLSAGTEVQLTYDGTNFRAIVGLPIAAVTNPVGVMLAFAGTTAPSGFLLCDGSDTSRTTHATLFGVIGTSYGIGDGSTTFTLPDYRGRVFVGLDNMGGSSANRITDANADSLNNTGFGSKDITLTGNVDGHSLTTAEMPSHDHNNGVADDTGTQMVYGTTTDDMPGLATATVSNGGEARNVQGVTSSKGNSNSHNHSVTGVGGDNTQPSLACGVIIKF